MNSYSIPFYNSSFTDLAVSSIHSETVAVILYVIKTNFYLINILLLIKITTCITFTNKIAS